MAGHSKWENIKRHKAVVDAKKGKIFQKHSREIYVATKAGGPDPDTNAALRLAIDRARAQNMPKDNIQRAIDKGSSSGDGDNFDEVTYEGYGPEGVAILVHALTDNRNRTATNVRTAITKPGGTMGSAGSVSYLFDRQGYIAIDRTKTDADEDTMLMAALEAGADSFEPSEDVYEIYTEPTEFTHVRDALKEEGFELAVAELTMVPQTSVPVAGEAKEILEKIIDNLEDDDDVQDVYHNAEMDDAE
ncbi:YebC/PmpR family DNA-binding transcriptional regulator [Dolosicoccus paucivorans]|uniref:YebC/PmpR family DNA-binding transcriptional regulator n=1 Tax=Dolosicoccus paucivorans TaxID=84521 RepID=UPI000888D2AF|nr:YebC/PmpR family DNA-binding transcriptional regulator [Dolosicoccus paucivorans]SDI42371.1 DNA-binding regulatory protein, YebC/PmpR family [Dolosicoccus paucivorans]